MAAPPGNPPTGYSLVHRFTVTGTRALLWLNLVGLSAFGLLGMLLTPAEIAAWIGITVAFNAASSLGDLWMAAVTASFPPQARFRDEEDGMSIFLPEV